jgi:DNA modification methylase
MGEVKLLLGDCLDKLKELEDNSVDSVVTDPPYEIGFMGKGWDDSGIANNPELWKEVLRVLKPGGHLLSFSHSRTYHRQAVAVEDAGFEIRDQIMWIYGSGFPKSHNIGKAVDKLEGNEREVVDTKEQTGAKFKEWSNDPNETRWHNQGFNKVDGKQFDITKGNSDWEGWGTALKPAHEPIVMARKPFKGSVAENVLEWGTGGINVDGCRIGTDDKLSRPFNIPKDKNTYGEYKQLGNPNNNPEGGRFPANIIFDEEAGKILNEQSGNKKSTKRGAHNNKKTEHTNTYTPPQAMYSDANTYGDEGGASRFFYCPKASKKDRNEGCDEFEEKVSTKQFMDGSNNVMHSDGSVRKNAPILNKNSHPTVKPTDLMAYLIRLVTPKGGVVLDPFMGSGSTGKAAVREGMNFIGIEREEEYMEIAKSRIEHEQSKNKHQQFWTL